MELILEKFKVGNILIEVVDSKKEMGIYAAELFAKKILEKPDIVLGLCTGSTPVPVYHELISYYSERKISFKNVKTFNLDEYYPIHPSNTQSYQYTMMKDLFFHIDIPMQNIHFPNCLSHFPDQASQKYEELIESSGGIDLLLTGIGHNTHIGFNEPPTHGDCRTRLIELSDETRSINSRFFENIDEVPKYAITMGLKTILDSKEIILCAFNDSKSDTIYEVLFNKPAPEVPGAYIQNHRNCRFILDRAAAKKLIKKMEVHNGKF